MQGMDPGAVIAHFIGKALRPYVGDKLWNNTPKLDKFAARHFQLSTAKGIVLALLAGGLVVLLYAAAHFLAP